MKTRNFPRKKEARQARAAARDIEWAGLTPAQQMSRKKANRARYMAAKS